MGTGAEVARLFERMSAEILGKGFAAWIAISFLAILNGAFRELALRKFASEPYARAISTLMLAGINLAIAFPANGMIGVRSYGEAWAIGLLWLALTLAFEFLAGHWAFGNSWQKLLAEFNVFRGRFWVLVPLCTLFSPPFAFAGFDSKWALPYCVSMAIACGCFLLSLDRRSAARWIIGLIFLWAALWNSWIALSSPEAYKGFAEFALIPWYREFIAGDFERVATPLLLVIALAQLVAAACLMFGRALALGVGIIVVFLAAIAPLGLGSAFPFSLLVSLAALRLLGPDLVDPATASGA